MKKIVLMILVIFSFNIFSQNAKSDCISEEMLRATFIEPVLCNGNWVDIEITVQYTVCTDENGTIYVRIWKIYWDGGDCSQYVVLNQIIYNDAVKTANEDAIKRYAYTFPDCNNGYGITLLNFKASCYAVSNDHHTYGHWVMVCIPCYDNLPVCKCTFHVCTDFSVTPNEIKIIPQQPTTCEIINGSQTCTGVVPLMPPIGYSWNDDWTTECYGVSCGY